MITTVPTGMDTCSWPVEWCEIFSSTRWRSDSAPATWPHLNRGLSSSCSSNCGIELWIGTSSSAHVGQQVGGPCLA